MQKTRIPYATIAVLIAAFLFVNLLSVYDGHNWGGDFAQYIQHAKNIVGHKEYAFSYDLDSTPIVPPGYPLMLAAVIKLNGINFFAFKYLNILFWGLFVSVIYLIFRKELDSDYALLLSVWFLSSPYFFIFKQNVLSDVPFLFFVTASLYAFMQYDHCISSDTSKKWLAPFLVFVILIICASCVRFAGQLLFLSIFLYLFVAGKDKFPLLLIVPIMVIAIAVQKIMGVSFDYHFNEVAVPLKEWVGNSYGNMSEVIKTFFTYCLPVRTKLTVIFFSLLDQHIRWIVPAVLAAAAAFMVYKAKKRSISILDCFFIVYSAGLFVWWVRGGPRYLFPIIWIVAVYLVQLLEFVSNALIPERIKNKVSGKSVVSIVIVFLICHNAISITQQFTHNDNKIYTREVQEMVQWVKSNTDKNEHIMFQKPRVMGLLAERKSAAFLAKAEDSNYADRIKALRINYVVITKADTKLEYEYLNDWSLYTLKQLAMDSLIAAEFDTMNVYYKLAKDVDLKKVWENGRYMIFKVSAGDRKPA